MDRTNCVLGFEVVFNDPFVVVDTVMLLVPIPISAPKKFGRGNRH